MKAGGTEEIISKIIKLLNELTWMGRRAERIKCCSELQEIESCGELCPEGT